jgi:outer membrane protein assembly factor BamB
LGSELQRQWQAKIGGMLTAPTVDGGKVLVASVDRHQVWAIDAKSGERTWSFTAGARVDSPPTIKGGRAIFGCRDGYVYSVRLSDGMMVWRLNPTGQDRHMVANGQVESAWPIHGSVLIEDDVAYVMAGRSSYLDGGMALHRINHRTGEILSRTPVYSPDPETGRQPPQSGPAFMPGARLDILTADDRCVYLRDKVFDRDGRVQPEGNPHLFALTGFLDDDWAHRSYMIFGQRCSLSTGCSGRDRNLIFGRMIVFNDTTLYGYGRAKVHWSNQLQDGPYRLYAVSRSEGKPRWTQSIPIEVRAMVLADKVLFVAGPRAERGAHPSPSESGQRALLLALSASDGTELARHQLEGKPVFDGMAVAEERLYISLENGRLLCLKD